MSIENTNHWKQRWISALGATALLGLSACGVTREAAPQPDILEQIREALDARGDQVARQNEQARNSYKQIIAEKSIEGDQCVTWTRHHNREAIDEMSIYDVNSDSMWVGNLVRSKAASRGFLNTVRSTRAPLTLSIKGRARHKDGAALGDPSHTMAVPRPSEYERARMTLVDKGFEPQTSLECVTAEAHSAGQAFFNLRADVSKLSASIKTEIEKRSDRKSRLVTINCVQKYYSIDLDEPESRMGFFGTNQDVQELMSSIPAGDSISYVSSIQYGRRIIIIVRTNESHKEIDSKAQLAAKGVGWGAGVDAKSRGSDLFESDDFRVFVAGATPEDVANIFGNSKVSSREVITPLFNKGSEDRNVSYGVPLSYTLRLLSNAETLKVALVGDFAIPEYSKPTVAETIRGASVRILVHDDDFNSDSKFNVHLPDGTLVMSKVASGKGNTWRDGSVRVQELGDIPADKLNGDWTAELVAPGKDKAVYSLELWGNGGRTRLYASLPRGQQSENSFVSSLKHAVRFGYQKVHDGDCKLSDEDLMRVSKFSDEIEATRN